MLTALVIENGAISGIYKTIITANVSQSYIGDINHLDKYPQAGYTEGIEFSKANGFFTSGASMSSAAINNAINGALRYVEENIGSIYTESDKSPDEDSDEGNDEVEEGGQENE